MCIEEGRHEQTIEKQVIEKLEKEITNLKKEIDELKEVEQNHTELCEKIHDLSGGIPNKIMEDLWDLVYKHYEP